MSTDSRWTHQLYRLADYLYWEPQHINRQKRKGSDMQAYESSMRKIKTLEVPLNLLFNILLGLSPQRIKRRILGCFLAGGEPYFGQRLEYLSIYDRLPDDNIYFIQPDCVLESESANVCIELKIEARLTANQAYKYLALLGLWQTRLNQTKKPYLFFLTKKDLSAQWDYQERKAIFSGNNDLAALSHYLKSADLPARFNWTAAAIDPIALIRQVSDQVQLGWATWQTIGDVLQGELESLNPGNPTEGEEMLAALLGDFLAELTQRQLWVSSK